MSVSPSRRSIFVAGDSEIAVAVRHATAEAMQLSPRRAMFDPDPTTPPRTGGAAASSDLMRVPISDVPVRTVPTRRLSGSSTFGAAAQTFEMLPAITAQPPVDAQKVLVQKIRQCSVLFNFENPMEALGAKEAKRETLLEIVHYVIAFPNCLTPEVYQEVRAMVDVNVFRPLHPRSNPEGAEYDPEENEVFEEPAWPHLHAVYELLLRVLESPNFSRKQAKDAFKEEFALHLLKMFDTEDPRERDYLKMAVHRMYGRFLHLRTYMKDQMGYILMDYASSSTPTYFHGIPEILEILGSIVNGFAVPLKPANVDFLSHVLLPLVKLPWFKMYHSQLLYCLLHYLVKDPSLVVPIFRYMFRHWPVQVAKKQVLLLSYANEMVATLDIASLTPGAPLLFAQLAKTLQSPHFLVADRSLAILEGDKLMEYARRHAADVVKVVCPALQDVFRHHWNSQLQTAAFKLHKRFSNFSVSSTVATETDDATAEQATKWAKLFAMERSTAEKPARRQSKSKLDDSMIRALSKHGIHKMSATPNNRENVENGVVIVNTK